MQNIPNMEPVDVQVQIDAALAPIREQIAALQAKDLWHGERLSALDIWAPAVDFKIAALEEAVFPPPPPPPDPPPPAEFFVPTGWRQTINETFDIPCVEGEFATIYPQRGIKFYPRPYMDTRWQQNRANGQAIRGGAYSGDFISVADGVCRQRIWVRDNILQCSALVPVALAGVGTWGDAPGMIYEEESRAIFTDGIKWAHLLWAKFGTNTAGALTGGGGNGEIDYPESTARRRVECYVHHQNATVGNDQKQLVPSNVIINPFEWHTYRLEWDKSDHVKIWCDGVFIAEYFTRIPAEPMHAVFQNESWLDTAAIPANAEGLVETRRVSVAVPA
jgi:hypothetical protein